MQALKQENSKMVRDMDLVRDILLKIEQDPMCDGQHMVTLEMPDRSPEELYYHLTLLVEAGLVKADLNTSSLLPIEVNEIYRHPSPLKFAVLAVNIAIVAYLIYQIRSKS